MTIQGHGLPHKGAQEVHELAHAGISAAILLLCGLPLPASSEKDRASRQHLRLEEIVDFRVYQE